MEKYAGLSNKEITNSMKWFNAVRPLERVEAHWLIQQAEMLEVVKGAYTDREDDINYYEKLLSEIRQSDSIKETHMIIKEHDTIIN